MSDQMIKNEENISAGSLTMFCLPFAGGGASAYNSWVWRLSPAVNVCPIQLPGREDRIMEKPYDQMDVALKELEKAVAGCIKGPYVIWGHSMGGKLGYELEKRLEKHGFAARCLFVSGSRVPHLPEPDPICHLPDPQFKERLKRFEGTPQEILENKELLDFFLPMLRADFIMDETYCTKEVVRLKCPVMALGGSDDREAAPEAVRQWEAYTNSSFQCRIFPGGHFYIKEREEEVLGELKKQMEVLTHKYETQTV